MKLDEEFKALLPTLSEHEYDLLKESILEQGIINPIIIWDEENTIIDGHNRYSVYTKNLEELKSKGLDKLPIERLSFPNREAVKEWIIKHQLGRRNLSYSRWKYYLGVLYNQTKHQGKTCGKIYHKTAEVLAKEYNVSEKTVRNAGKYASNIAEIPKDYQDAVLNRDFKITDQELDDIIKNKDKGIEKLIAAILNNPDTIESEIQLQLIDKIIERLKLKIEKINPDRLNEVRYKLKSIFEDF